MFNPTVIVDSYTWTIIGYRGLVIKGISYHSRSFDLDFWTRIQLSYKFMLLSSLQVIAGILL